MACARAACEITADYSAVSGERILPFVFTLDLVNSNLYPAEGENQRFCYTVAGVGEDAPEYADLSHFVMGVCGEIRDDMLRNVSLSIDGVAQEVTVGENVLMTDADPTTGCPGLKADFGLDKVGGEMRFCFELARPFAVGPVPLCLKGGQQTAVGLALCGPVCAAEVSCTVYGHQRATVCVPVTVTPYAVAGEAVTYCCGSPTVTPGAAACGGTPMGGCTFTVRQDVCVAVPIDFGANALIGGVSVLCGDAAAGEACEGCEE